MRNFLSKFLIIFGLACYAATIYFVNERTNPKRVSFVANQYIQADNLKHNKVMPVRIEIPSASISLPVIPAQIKNKEWEATSEGVSFLVSSEQRQNNSNRKNTEKGLYASIVSVLVKIFEGLSSVFGISGTGSK